METKRNALIEAIDYRLQTIAREADEQAPKHIPGTSQLTVRIDNDLKAQLDVVSQFLMTTRNSLINEFLQVAVEEAYQRLCDNPYVRDVTMNGKTIKEAMLEALQGTYEGSKQSDLIHDIEIGKVDVKELLKGTQK